MSKTATPEELFAFLDQHGIQHSTLEHPALFSVEDGRDWHDKIPGMHGKNLFLKDRKDKIWLIVMPGDKRADTNQIEKQIGSARLSFAKPEVLLEVLKLTPGSVTPFGLLNDSEKRVNVAIDSDLLQSPLVNFHPLRNTASTTLKADDLTKFINLLGYEYKIINCGTFGS